MYRDGKGGFVGSTWPHNPICVNAGMVHSFAIDWRNYSGDTRMISITRKGLDHQIGMAAVPEWAPADENHLLRSSSVIKKIQYGTKQINFTTFDNSSKEVLTLIKKSLSVSVDKKSLNETKNAALEGYTWQPLKIGRGLKLNHTNGNKVKIIL